MKLIQGHEDIPLNGAGLRTAQNVALHLRDWVINRVYASPLQRVTRTVDVIVEEQNRHRLAHGQGIEPMQLEHDRRLMGQGMGVLTGRP